MPLFIAFLGSKPQSRYLMWSYLIHWQPSHQIQECCCQTWVVSGEAAQCLWLLQLKWELHEEMSLCWLSTQEPDHIVKIKFSEILFMLFFSVWMSSTAQWHWQSAYPCSYNCVHFWAVFRVSVILGLYNLERTYIVAFSTVFGLECEITTAVKCCTANKEEFE